MGAPALKGVCCARPSHVTSSPPCPPPLPCSGRIQECRSLRTPCVNGSRTDGLNRLQPPAADRGSSGGSRPCPSRAFSSSSAGVPVPEAGPHLWTLGLTPSMLYRKFAKLMANLAVSQAGLRPEHRSCLQTLSPRQILTDWREAPSSTGPSGGGEGSEKPRCCPQLSLGEPRSRQSHTRGSGMARHCKDNSC